MESKRNKQSIKLYNEGINFFLEKKYEEAIGCWKKSVKLDKENFRAFVYLGMAYFHLRNYDDSIESYKRALEINSSYHKALNNLGNLYRKKGELFKAQDAYKKAADLDPENITYHYNLGITSYDILEYDIAIREFLYVLENEPDNREIKRDLSNAYYRVRKFQKALDCLKEYLDIIGDSIEKPQVLAKINMIKNDIIDHNKK